MLPPVPQAFCTSLNWGSNLAVGATVPAMLATLGIAGALRMLRMLCNGHGMCCWAAGQMLIS